MIEQQDGWRKENWMGLAEGWGAAQGLAASLYDGIVASYGSGGRLYHTLDHIASVLRTLERFGPGDDPAALMMAAWYHDIVYDTRAADNEEQSAGRARRELRALGAPEPFIDRVARLVLATKDHRIEPGDDDGALFLDADLAILGAPEDAYHSYSIRIRMEYGWVTASSYRAGRTTVLEDFLLRQRIYRTGKMFERYEAAARANIAGELLRLRSGSL